MMFTGTPSRGELDRVRVPQLMRREAAAHAALGGELPEFAADGRGWPSATAGRAVDDAEQRSDRQLHAVLEPPVEVIETPVIHPRLAALVVLPVPDQQRPASLVDIGLAGREGFRDPRPAAPQHRDHRPDPQTVPVLAGVAHHSDDLLDPRRISRIPHALVVRRATGQVSGQR
jgi:hypothetical protein